MSPFQEALVSLFGPASVYWFEIRVKEGVSILNWGCRSISQVFVYGIVVADFKVTLNEMLATGEKQIHEQRNAGGQQSG